MARPRAQTAATDIEVTEEGKMLLTEFGGGESSISPGFLIAYAHAKNHGNDEKACILWAMNHGQDDEFQPVTDG
jgi:hypothetical protein